MRHELAHELVTCKVGLQFVCSYVTNDNTTHSCIELKLVMLRASKPSQTVCEHFAKLKKLFCKVPYVWSHMLRLEYVKDLDHTSLCCADALSPLLLELWLITVGKYIQLYEGVLCSVFHHGCDYWTTLTAPMISL